MCSKKYSKLSPFNISHSETVPCIGDTWPPLHTRPLFSTVSGLNNVLCLGFSMHQRAYCGLQWWSDLAPSREHLDWGDGCYHCQGWMCQVGRGTPLEHVWVQPANSVCSLSPYQWWYDGDMIANVQTEQSSSSSSDTMTSPPWLVQHSSSFTGKGLGNPSGQQVTRELVLHPCKKEGQLLLDWISESLDSR